MKTRLLAALGSLTLATGAALIAAHPAGASTPICRSSQLRPHYDGQQGAAGTLYDLWHVTNIGSTCQTTGFVGAQNFASDGRPYQTTVSWVGASSTVVLTPAASAHWRFYYVQPSILGCTPENAVNMIVTPPNNTRPILLGRGEKACTGTLRASALQPGV